MRINILQHTPNEGPGTILDWANEHHHSVYIYHPYQFHLLPTANETDLLVILGGPMSPNDDLPWIHQERALIKQLIQANKPIFGACFGAQQITMSLGYSVHKSPVKEVGWAPIYVQTDAIPNIPQKLVVLHWHEEMFDIPTGAQLLFSSDHLANQGFIFNQNVVGLQCHLEPKQLNIREMVVNDAAYISNSVLNQTATDILNHAIPIENKQAMFAILDDITTN